MAENSTQSDSIDDVKQKLTNVEQQVKEQKQALDEQRLKAKRMEKQVDCNWRLLNDYKSCEEKFNKPSSEYLSCTSDAKQVYQQCLAAIDGD